jgi:argininosuccinate synthase
MSVQS